jgi:hypothetical protein
VNDALPVLGMFGLAASLAALGFVVWIGGRIWLRAKQLERDEMSSLPAGAAAEIAGTLASIEARLSRLEQSVDATAVEVERIAESQRFSARLLAGGAGDSARDM